MKHYFAFVFLICSFAANAQEASKKVNIE